jgi:hypothetical protein
VPALAAPGADAGAPPTPGAGLVHAVAQPWTLGSFGYTVTDVRASPTAGDGGDRISADRGNVFVLVHYTEVNNGNAVAYGSADNVTLREAGGAAHQTSARAQAALVGSWQDFQDMIAIELPPHTPRRITAAFELDQAAARRPLEVVFEARGLFNRATASVYLPAGALRLSAR